VVSDKAIFGFDEETRRMKLLAVCPWATVDEVLEDMDFEPLVAEPVTTVAPPTEEQLTVLRAKVDPRGRVIDQGKWITYKPES
jgi:glutaconate CoA-transferase subunit B